ncbi:MAG TPA: MaoC/PaaZ C-terminal domain-containing protein [Candidatus Limnocylindrales bacterium]|nr:MaoC/PaaZ C-terminal domain-containing protein [Candidatus Limnocylindrales bacterium]
MKNLIYEEIEVGEDLGPYQHPLTKQLVQKYCAAIDSTYPWQILENSTPIPVVPPTLIGNLSFRLLETKFYRQPGTIHASQEMKFFRPIRLDRKLFSRGRMLDKYIKRGKRWVVYEAYFYHEDEQDLGYSRITEVLPGFVREPEEHRNPIEPRDAQTPRRMNFELPSTSQGISAPGTVLGPVIRKITQEKMTAYSEDSQTAQRGISIHIHEEVARKAGLKGTVAQGLMFVDYISELMAQTFGMGWIQHGELSVKFIASVYAGDEITARGVVKEQVIEGTYPRTLVEVWCENQAGQKVTVGIASAINPQP